MIWSTKLNFAQDSLRKATRREN